MAAEIITPQASNVEPDGSYRTHATSRGESRGDVSAQWFKRPDDQRFTSLQDLMDFLNGVQAESYHEDIETTDIEIHAEPDDPNSLRFELPGGPMVLPTHWGFGQLCSALGAHASYLRKLPARLAGACLQYHLNEYEGREGSKLRAYLRKRSGIENAEAELRAMTSTSYGRIYDAQVVHALMQFAGNGNGDTRWKVPGVLDWGSLSPDGTVRYNPNIDVTKDTTTLFGSDRDVFCFLVDDRNPIEVAPGDLMFRGFYARNSEVGASKYVIASMLLRGVCENRCLWGVDGFETLEFNHTSGAPERFLEETAPALQAFAEGGTDGLVEAVRAAKAARVGRDAESRLKFLDRAGIPKKQAEQMLALVETEEGHPAESVYDMVNGITAFARSLPHNDARLALEHKAGALFDKAA